jgi:4'-phosphopantetheinyl transferase
MRSVGTEVTVPASAGPVRAPARVGPGSIRIERLSLDLPEGSLAARRGHLSDDERATAGRFRFARDRRRYVAARGGLRALLGSHLAIPPDEVRFNYGPLGKPALAAGQERSGIRFNLTHSEDLALCAVTGGLEVGIDLERVRPLPDLEALADHFFAPGERAALRRLPGALREEGFFRCWTRKEAYLKGRGDGLALPLDSFEVSIDPDEPARLLRVDDRPGDVESWRLEDVPVRPGFAAALAVRRGGEAG